MQDQIKDEWIEAAQTAAANETLYATIPDHAMRAALAAVAPLIRAEAEAEVERLRELTADLIVSRDREKGFYEQARADLAQAQAQNEALRKALEYAAHAIETGRSEPLFAARDLIKNTLEDCAAGQENGND